MKKKNRSKCVCVFKLCHYLINNSKNLDVFGWQADSAWSVGDRGLTYSLWSGVKDMTSNAAQHSWKET